MARENSPLGYVVGLFDVLGFEFRLKKFGLDEILKRYNSIVSLVKGNSEKNRLLVECLNITAPIHTKDGPPAFMYDVRAVYSSDTIMLWSNLAWRAVQNQSIETLKKNENHPAYGHFSKPIPLEPYLSMCAEILCRSIEIDLPLRGALAMGDAEFNEKDRIFIGNPIVDAARLEKEQNIIGLGICNSFVEQKDHNIYFLPYSKHIKETCKEQCKKFVLNWPLYWKNSRKTDPKIAIINMAKQNNNHQYYLNTIEFIEFSENFKYH